MPQTALESIEEVKEEDEKNEFHKAVDNFLIGAGSVFVISIAMLSIYLYKSRSR